MTRKTTKATTTSEADDGPIDPKGILQEAYRIGRRYAATPMAAQELAFDIINLIHKSNDSDVD